MTGDLDGFSRWTIASHPTGTAATFTEEVVATKPLLRKLEPIARPAFKANHTRMMRDGERGLAHVPRRVRSPIRLTADAVRWPSAGRKRPHRSSTAGRSGRWPTSRRPTCPAWACATTSTTEDGDRVGVLVHRTGRRDVFLYSRTTPTSAAPPSRSDPTTPAHSPNCSARPAWRSTSRPCTTGRRPHPRLDHGVALVGVGRTHARGRRRSTPPRACRSLRSSTATTSPPPRRRRRARARCTGRRHRYRRQARVAHREARRALSSWCSGPASQDVAVAFVELGAMHPRPRGARAAVRPRRHQPDPRVPHRGCRVR